MNPQDPTYRALNPAGDPVLRLALEASGVAVAIVWSDGLHVYHNQAFTRLFGYAVEELSRDVSAPLSLYDDPADRAALFDRILKGLPWQGEVTMVDREGRRFPAELRADPLKDEEGRVRGAVKVCTDITEKRNNLRRIRQLSRAVEQTASTVVITDRHGNIEYANPKFVEITGYSLEEALGQNPRMLKSGATPAEGYAEMWKTICNGNVWRGEFLNRRKNGELYWEAATISPVIDENDAITHFVAVKEDITEHKRAHEALAESEARFRTLFQLAPDCIYLHDLEGNFVDGNARAEQLTGYAREELIGRNFLTLNLLAPEDLPAAAEGMARNALGEATGPVEYCLIRKDGSRAYVEVRAFPLRLAGQQLVLGVARDVTERKLAAQRLRESEERFRLIAETIDEVFWIADAAIDRVLYASPAFERVWGRTCEELYRDYAVFLEAIHPDDLERVVAGVKRKEDGQAFELEYRIVRPDGTIRWIWDRGFPVRDASGKVTSHVGVAQDITLRKSIEEQFWQAQKMEAVGRLAGGVAHDFNNILMVINGHCDLILKQLSTLDPLRQQIAEIGGAGARAAALTRQLLAFSRRQIVQPRVLDLNAAIQGATSMLRRLIGDDIRLSTTFGDRLGKVMADPGQIDQVLMNLAVNARDAMPEGGELAIETADVNIDATYAQAHVEINPGPYVRLSVSDTGTGMEPEVLAHAFELFFTTKSPGQGTGLGLATVFGVVKQVGGSIWVYSEPGKGTTFRIYLPRVEDSAVAEEPKPVSGVLAGTETILLVEDQADLRRMARTALEEYGYDVHEAANGAEAMALAAKYQGTIDLLLTDVVMPGMSGPELAGRLRPLRPEMKALYMSGYSDAVFASRRVLEEGVAYLQKPVSPHDLAVKVREVLAPPRSSGSILVVDDESAVRSVIREILQSAGYEVQEAEDGKRAMRRIADSLFDLVITDVVMPEQEGIETIAAIRKQCPRMKIVAMSGAVFGIHYLRIAEKLGADMALAKPISPDELLRAVRQLITARS